MKSRTHKHFLDPKESKGIVNMLKSKDIESQILGLTVLKNTKTFKHYHTEQNLHRYGLRYYDVKSNADLRIVINYILKKLRFENISLHSSDRLQISHGDIYTYMNHMTQVLINWIQNHTI